MTTVQRMWIKRVVTSRAYAGVRNQLRFAIVPVGDAVPIVVYVSLAKGGEPDGGGHVIGAPCNVYFDPSIHGVFAGTGALCARPTSKPI